MRCAGHETYHNFVILFKSSHKSEALFGPEILHLFVERTRVAIKPPDYESPEIICVRL